MQLRQPSRTAYAAAYHRAAHQLLEGGRIFSDPVAVAILGNDAPPIDPERESEPPRRRMRMFIAVRARFAEDALARAVDVGLRQLVVLGAGLDTYAYRGAVRDRLRIFEVDHPDTQAWKRERLREVGIVTPSNLAFASVDFEKESLPSGLRQAGFDESLPAFFVWLGVVPYLRRDSIQSTLGYVAGLPRGSEVVFDYINPPESFSPERQAEHDRRAQYAAGLGEPWLSYFVTSDLHADLTAMGFLEIEDLGPMQIAARYFPGSSGSGSNQGGHIVRAATR